MRHLKLLLVLLHCIPGIICGQNKPVVLTAREYAAQIKIRPERRLIEIKKATPGIQLDIKYATTDNFMHRVTYSQARAFVRAPVAEALQQIQAELKLRGLGIKIFDAYRP